jgi:hypothetical protein
MIRTSRKYRCRWKITIAMFAVSAAFVGGGQALAPPQAIATITDGSGPCSGEFWFDQFCIVEDGDAAPGGGADPAPAADSGDEELIEIEGKAPTVVKVPVGVRNGSSGPDGREPGDSRGEGHGRDGGKYIPRCKNGRTTNCRQPDYDCMMVDGTLVRVYNEKECGKANDEFQEKEAAKARQRSICTHLRLTIEAANEKIDNWVERYVKRGRWNEIQDDPDVQDVISAYIHANKLWEDHSCLGFFQAGSLASGKPRSGGGS